MGDLVVPYEHSGDCYYDYALIEGGFTLHDQGQQGPGYRRCRGGNFGAYVLGVPLDRQPNEVELLRLMSHQSTFFSDSLDVDEAIRCAVQSALLEERDVLERAVQSYRRDFERERTERVTSQEKMRNEPKE